MFSGCGLLTLIVAPVLSELYPMHYIMQILHIQVDDIISLQITSLLELMAIHFTHQLFHWINFQYQFHITYTSMTILTCVGHILICIMIDEMCFSDTSSNDLSADLCSGCEWYYVINITTTLATTTMKGQTTMFL